ncbi:MAG: hypothetical protein ACI88H_004144 [Cocleimonas sp.]|jgi:hypothetical protein
MNNLRHKISLLLFASTLSILMSTSTLAAIALSAESVNSLSISSIRSENNSHYLIEIYIEGIATSKVTFETDFQTLYLKAKNGGMISDGAMAGTQVISLVFDFPADANLNNVFRADESNKIVISVPKSKAS